MKTRAHRWSSTVLCGLMLCGIGSLVSSCKERSASQAASPLPKAPEAVVQTTLPKTSVEPLPKPVKASAVRRPKGAASKKEPQRLNLPTAGRVAPRKKAATFPPFEGTTIAVVHTVNMVGEIEPCG